MEWECSPADSGCLRGENSQKGHLLCVKLSRICSHTVGKPCLRLNICCYCVYLCSFQLSFLSGHGEYKIFGLLSRTADMKWKQAGFFYPSGCGKLVLFHGPCVSHVAVLLFRWRQNTVPGTGCDNKRWERWGSSVINCENTGDQEQIRRQL